MITKRCVVFSSATVTNMRIFYTHIFIGFSYGIERFIEIYTSYFMRSWVIFTIKLAIISTMLLCFSYWLHSIFVSPIHSIIHFGTCPFVHIKLFSDFINSLIFFSIFKHFIYLLNIGFV